MSCIKVTQLYVSVDASTRDALKEIDRPLFADFWERFNDSLKALKKVKGRTVFRLTLVKDKNVGRESDMEGYAKLIADIRPELIEIKGVTFCGKSDASDIRMTNVPWHSEVRQFSIALCKRVSDLLNGDDAYGVACEHKHSVCVLLAKKETFFENDEWYTWIDYEKFHELERRRKLTGEEYSAKDYRKKTPSWAVFGSPEQVRL